MSAPERVRTADGMVWERRTETRGGLALYAVEGAPKCCPPFVMATLAELAEHGVRADDERSLSPQREAEIRAGGCEYRSTGLLDRDIADLLAEVGRLRARVAELEAAAGTAFRASHDSIPMGMYTTAQAARDHCESEERRSWSKGANPSFDWIEDDEDGIAELVATVDGEEIATGYVVTPLTVACEYDADGDE